MYGKTKFNFWFDVTIFITFAVTAIIGLMLWLIIPSGRGSGWLVFFGLTRHQWVDIHNWVGLAMLIGVILHLVLHLPWITCAIKRFFGRLARQARLNFSLNSLMFAVFFLVNLSGLVAWLVLPSGGYRGGRNPFYGATLFSLTRHEWNDIHLWAGLTLIAILAIHLVLHWPWVVCTLRDYVQATLHQPDECDILQLET
jgi:hypothetical protein